MDSVLLIVHIIITVALIGLVLVQQGKGADMGAAFGSGASQTVFGASGSGNFLSRTTAFLATGFFLTSLVLAYFSGQVAQNESVVDRVQAPVESSAPASSEVPAEDDLPLVPEEAPSGELPPE